MTENKVKFYLYEKRTQGGPVRYARFLNETTLTYDITRSTGVFVKGRNGSRGAAHDKAAAMLSTVRLAKSKTGVQLFADYGMDFWSDHSPYVREAAQVKQKPLSAAYLLNNRNAIKNHAAPSPR